MRAAIYCRKSTLQTGREEAKSVVRQEEGARAWCEARGWEVADVYTDDAVSGMLFLGRPGFQRMLAAARAKAFGAVVFFDLDRFGRGFLKSLEALIALTNLGVEIWDFGSNEMIDLNDSTTRLRAVIRAEQAEATAQQGRKHTKAGLLRNFHRGEATGAAPYGYRNETVGDPRHGKRVLVKDAAEAVVVREVFRRYASGQGIHVIVRSLNERRIKAPRKPWRWNSTTLRGLLRRSIYRGVVTYAASKMAYEREAAALGKERAQLSRPEAEWLTMERPELRLVDLRIAAKVDARLAESREAARLEKETKRNPTKATGKYLLSGGLLVCPDCGRGFEARHGSSWRGRGVYVCGSRRWAPGTCPNRLVLDIATTDAAVLNGLTDAVVGKRLYEAALDLIQGSPEDDLRRLTAERERVQASLDRLVSAVADGLLEPGEIAAKAEPLRAEIAKLDAAISRPKVVPVLSKAELKAAILQRTKTWRKTLRDEPKVARLLLREILGPITVASVPKELPPFIVPGDERGKENITPDMTLFWQSSMVPEAVLRGLVDPSALLGRLVRQSSDKDPLRVGGVLRVA